MSGMWNKGDKVICFLLGVVVDRDYTIFHGGERNRLKKINVIKFIFKKRFSFLDWLIMTFVGNYIRKGEPLILLCLVVLWVILDELADKIVKGENQ